MILSYKAKYPRTFYPKFRSYNRVVRSLINRNLKILNDYLFILKRYIRFFIFILIRLLIKINKLLIIKKPSLSII